MSDEWIDYVALKLNDVGETDLGNFILLNKNKSIRLRNTFRQLIKLRYQKNAELSMDEMEEILYGRLTKMPSLQCYYRILERWRGIGDGLAGRVLLRSP